MADLVSSAASARSHRIEDVMLELYDDGNKRPLTTIGEVGAPLVMVTFTANSI